MDKQSELIKKLSNENTILRKENKSQRTIIGLLQDQVEKLEKSAVTRRRTENEPQVTFITDNMFLPHNGGVNG